MRSSPASAPRGRRSRRARRCTTAPSASTTIRSATSSTSSTSADATIDRPVACSRSLAAMSRPRAEVDAAERLVEQQHPRGLQQPAPDDDLLLVAARERLDRRLRPGGRDVAGHGSASFVRCAFAADAGEEAPQRARAWRCARTDQPGISACAARSSGTRCTPRPIASAGCARADRSPVELDPAAGERPHAEQRAEQLGLARADQPGQPEHLARAQLEVERLAVGEHAARRRSARPRGRPRGADGRATSPASSPSMASTMRVGCSGRSNTASSRPSRSTATRSASASTSDEPVRDVEDRHALLAQRAGRSPNSRSVSAALSAEVGSSRTSSRGERDERRASAISCRSETPSRDTSSSSAAFESRRPRPSATARGARQHPPRRRPRPVLPARAADPARGSRPCSTRGSSTPPRAGGRSPTPAAARGERSAEARPARRPPATGPRPAPARPTGSCSASTCRRRWRPRRARTSPAAGSRLTPRSACVEPNAFATSGRSGDAHYAAGNPVGGRRVLGVRAPAAWPAAPPAS